MDFWTWFNEQHILLRVTMISTFAMTLTGLLFSWSFYKEEGWRFVAHYVLKVGITIWVFSIPGILGWY